MDRSVRTAADSWREGPGAQVGVLLAAGADVHATTGVGAQPLHEAAERGNASVPRALCRVGA